MKSRRKTPAKVRFWRKVEVGTADSCWLWKDPEQKHYANFWDGRKQIGAHRYSLELKLGRELKEGEFACHTCDNKRCVNPKHLFPGTRLDNSRDMVSKNRKEVGQDVFGAKMTDEKVRSMRKRYAKNNISIRRLARYYGITDSNASYILQGKTWKHVGGPIDNRSSTERRRSGKFNA